MKKLSNLIVLISILSLSGCTVVVLEEDTVRHQKTEQKIPESKEQSDKIKQ